jgi:hypothetical protein
LITAGDIYKNIDTTCGTIDFIQITGKLY